MWNIYFYRISFYIFVIQIKINKYYVEKSKKLNREDLREINGGGPGNCDIGPIDCPCIIPPGDPCLDGPGGGGDPVLGYCPDSQTYIPCDQVCPNGLQPLCPLG